MESQPQNPEFRNKPENFHPCLYTVTCIIKFITFHTKNKVLTKTVKKDKFKYIYFFCKCKTG